MKIKLIIISLIAVSCLLFVVSQVFAQILYKPQIPIPETKFAGPVEITGQTLALLIAELYIWGIRILAMVAVIMITIAGFRWMAAAGNQSIIGKAKEQITGALMGLILAIGAHFLLNFINPNLVFLKTLDIVQITKIHLKTLCKDLPAEQQPTKEKEEWKDDGGFIWKKDSWWCIKKYKIEPEPGKPDLGQFCDGDACPDNYSCSSEGICLIPSEVCCKTNKNTCATADKEINSDKYACRKANISLIIFDSSFCALQDLLKCPSSHPERVDCRDGPGVCWQGDKPKRKTDQIGAVCKGNQGGTTMVTCQNKEVRAGLRVDAICCKNTTTNKFELWSGPK